MYDENYYKSINYVGYLDRGPRYEKLAEETMDLLKKLTLINSNDSVLDYGCAVGFLMQGLTKLGYTNTTGFDISTWAVKEAQSKGLNVLQEYGQEIQYRFRLGFFLDVLEHMSDNDIKKLLQEDLLCSVMIVRIPVSTDGKTFHLDVSKRDPTHINCKTKTQWHDLLQECGFNVFLNLNLNTIFDSDGVMACLCLRGNQSFCMK